MTVAGDPTVAWRALADRHIEDQTVIGTLARALITALDTMPYADVKRLLTDLTVAVDRFMQESQEGDAAYYVQLWKAMGVAVEAAGEVVYPL